MAEAYPNTRRPEVAIFILLGLALLLGAVGAKWWHVIGTPQPGYFALCRLLALLCAGLAGVALLRPTWRAALLMSAGSLAAALPLLALLTVVTLDAPSIAAAIHQTNQADRLVNFLNRVDINPQVAWTERRSMRAYAVIRNDFTLVDGLEAASFFAKPGWYLCLLGGLLLLTAAWLWDGKAARSCLHRRRGGIAAVCVALALLFFARMAVGHVYWHLARAAEARADYPGALYNYRKAAQWDIRLDYDLAFHFELGRLYGRLGMTNEPDYWASLGEIYLNTNLVPTGYELYRRNIPNPYVNPAIQMRYANTLLKIGVLDYVSALPGSAMSKWQRAIEIDPNNIEIMYALAQGYTKLRNYPKAIRWWQEIIQANESVGLFRSKYVASFTYRKMITARAWSSLGWCYYQQHNYDMAQQCDAFSIQQGGSSADSLP